MLTCITAQARRQNWQLAQNTKNISQNNEQQLFHHKNCAAARIPSRHLPLHFCSARRVVQALLTPRRREAAGGAVASPSNVLKTPLWARFSVCVCQSSCVDVI